MAEYINSSGIRCFEPDNSPNDFYIAGYSDPSLDWLLEVVKIQFPEAKLDEITVSSEYIHTDALGYDLYDPSDYTCYIHLHWEKK